MTVSVTKRSVKGQALTWDEVDANFGDLADEVNGLFINPENYSAVGNGTTDDTAAIAAALTAASSANKAVYLDPVKKYRVSSITVPAGVQVIGGLSGRDITTDNVEADYTTLGGALLVNAGATITLSAGAALRNTMVRQYGQTYPQSSSSAWTGTAITIAGYGAEVTGNWIVGFDTAITSTNYSRLLIEENSIDANNGISITGSYDTTRILNNQLWPFATHKSYQDGGATDETILYRTGNGINLGAGNDHTTLHGNLMYGYLVGINCSGGSVAMGENWVDHPAAQARSGNYGVKFNANSNSVKVGNLWVWGCNVGVYFDQASTETVDIETLLLKYIDDDAVVIDSGTMNIDTLDVDDIGASVFNITSDSVRCHVGYARIQNATGPVLEATASLNSDSFRIENGWDDYSNGTDPLLAATRSSYPHLPPILTAAASLGILTHGNFFRVDGTTTIDSITPSWAGRVITLYFTDTADVDSVGTSVTGTCNIYLAGNTTFTTIAAKTTLTLVYTGYEWLELSRSVNA